MKSVPTFVLKTGLLPTFIRAVTKNRSVKVGLWPKKVGKSPFFGDKSGQENGLKNLKNRPKSAKNSPFSGFLGCFSRKIEVSAHLPTFIFYFYKKLKIKYYI